MTNSWAMLFDYIYGRDDVISSNQYTDDTAELILNDLEAEAVFAAGMVPIPGAAGEDVITFDIPESTTQSVVISEDESAVSHRWEFDI